ncbi:Hypothetical protein, putative [Bodo saltans]|uniref:Uncharacterized protein n=1 Tax=Bodo saltans TaxID=75058 RepID=A0A0S4IU50_BODSA|nr:Hypothetical protein, putative [Bodo saltans]|eukprot:CUF95093.1 Hypothetical protein, putative [Bodo saltans]
MSWTVLLIQNEHCWDEYKAETPDQPKKHVLDVWRGKLAYLPAVIRDTAGAVRMLATTNPMKAQLSDAPICPFEWTEENPEVTERYAELALKSRKLAEANEAFIALVESKPDRHDVEDAVCKWAVANSSPKDLSTEDRATQLLEQIQRSRVELNEKKHYSMGSGPVIAEFLIDLDNISKWCPTIGVFVSNIVKIRELMDTPGSSSSEPTTSANT